jgi:hypothetical protein
MSFGVDVNILLYASDSSRPQHAKAAEFLQGCVHRREVFCVAWVTLMSYLRMATHPAIFERPLSHEQAARNVESLLDLPHCRVLAEDEGFWTIYREITGDVPTRGNLVPDAHLAAILRQHGVRVICTHDRGFRKFPFLEVRDPIG